MPASIAASEERVIRTFASFRLEARVCDWPLARSESDVTIGEIQFGFAPLVNPVGSGLGFEVGGFLDVREGLVFRLKPDLRRGS